MRVGLMIGHTEPDDGGGYNFIVELLAALERVVSHSPHEFVLFHYASPEVAARAATLPAVDLRDRQRELLSWPGRVVDRYPEIVQRTYRHVFRLRKPHWAHQVYSQSKIQFLLRLAPWDFPKYDIPYGALVWNVAHRTDPWLPEVGAYTHWRSREESYSSLLRRAVIVYVGAEQVRHDLEFYYQVPAERICVLQPPISSFATNAARRSANPNVLRRFELPKDYIFYPAMFWPQKNHVVVLEACKIIREKMGWSVGVVFTGSDQGNHDYVRSYAQRLGLAEVCRFLGFVEQHELVELYRAAVCLAFPSFVGPDALPPLEAFALGCPVVAARLPGTAERIGDCALLFDPSDEAALATHILSLRDPVTRQRLVANGQKYGAGTQTWDDYARGMISTLDKFERIRRAWA